MGRIEGSRGKKKRVVNSVSWLQMVSVWAGKQFLIIFYKDCREMDGTIVEMKLFP